MTAPLLNTAVKCIRCSRNPKAGLDDAELAKCGWTLFRGETLAGEPLEVSVCHSCRPYCFASGGAVAPASEGCDACPYTGECDDCEDDS